MTGFDGFTIPCSSDALNDGNGGATTTPAIVRLHACQDIFQEHRGDSACTQYVVRARMGKEHPPRTVMFGELVGGKGYSGRQEKDWIMRLKEDMTAFEIKFEGWRKDAQTAGRWFRRAEEGEQSSVRKKHDAERCGVAEQHT